MHPSRLAISLSALAFVAAGCQAPPPKVYPALEASTELVAINPADIAVLPVEDATQDRAAALQGADYVIVTILAGGLDVWRHDIEIPKKYGLRQTIGDTLGVGGIMRALRTIPVLLEMTKARFSRPRRHDSVFAN